MLLDSKLLKSFGRSPVTEYLRTEVTKVIEGMTPHGRGLRRNHAKALACFGCDAYVHIPRDERQNTKNTKCIFFMERKQKGRLYDPNQGRVIFSRDVKFNESEERR